MEELAIAHTDYSERTATSSPEKLKEGQKQEWDFF
jgi:hypothetical protein